MHRVRSELRRTCDVMGPAALRSGELPDVCRRSWGLLGRARDLPETALRATSRRPTTQHSAAPFTCSVVWVGEVVRCDVNHPHINGIHAREFATSSGTSFPPQ